MCSHSHQASWHNWECVSYISTHTHTHQMSQPQGSFQMLSWSQHVEKKKNYDIHSSSAEEPDLRIWLAVGTLWTICWMTNIWVLGIQGQKKIKTSKIFQICYLSIFHIVLYLCELQNDYTGIFKCLTLILFLKQTLCP